jgi:hypothetical protein
MELAHYFAVAMSYTHTPHHPLSPTFCKNPLTMQNSSAPALYITGLGSQYPPYLLGAKDLDNLAARFYDVTRPG